MNGLFDNPVLKKLQAAGEAIGRNKFLSSLQGGMSQLMGIIMVGAIFQIVCVVVGPNVLNVVPSDSSLYAMLNLPYQLTVNILAFWTVAFMAYRYATILELDAPVVRMADVLVCFLMVAAPLGTNEAGSSVLDMTYLGASGMFVGFLVVFIVIQVEKFCADKNIRIKMPESVPAFLADGFSAIIPLLFNAIIFTVLSGIVSAATAGQYTLCSGFMALISAPLNVLISVPGMFVLCILGALLWSFGIHGSSILNGIIMPVMYAGMAANADAMAAGQALTFYPAFLYTCMSCCGGSGNTLSLVLMGLRSKSEQIKAVSKASLVPGLCQINEPVVFGMPIMYNPLLCIPYILNIVVVMALTLVAYNLGLLTPYWIMTGGVMPMGFATYFRSLNWMNPVWDFIMLIPTGLVWYPFFKAYERQLVKQEQAAEAELEA